MEPGRATEATERKRDLQAPPRRGPFSDVMAPLRKQGEPGRGRLVNGRRAQGQGAADYGDARVSDVSACASDRLPRSDMMSCLLLALFVLVRDAAWPHIRR